MTSAEKRQKVVDKGLTRKGKNQYSQDSTKRTKVSSGYSDCSAFTRWCYKEELSIDIGVNTEAQIKSSKMTTIDANIKNGIPDTSKLHKGDLFYFRGNNTSRTEGVGHVEMYIGNNKLLGHGSSIGPTEKQMDTYCKQRQNTKSSNKNNGLICVRRVVADDKIEETISKPSDTPNKYSTSLTGYVGTSIVDAFKSKKLDPSFANRKKYADAVGMKNYKGLGDENITLLKLLGAK